MTGTPAGGMLGAGEDVNREDTMPSTEPHRTPEGLARLGAEAFDRHVRPTLRPEDDGKFVAIDLVTGDHVMDTDDCAAVMRLRPAGRLPTCGSPASASPRRTG